MNYQVYEPRSDMRDVDMAYNPDKNEYLVVYRDDYYGASWGTTQVYGQFVRADGSIRQNNLGANGSRFAIASDSTKYQYRPKVAYNPVTKTYLVTWVQGTTTAASTYDVYAKLLSDNGAALGGSLVIANKPSDTTGAAVSQDWPDVAASTNDGRFLVSWADYHLDGTHSEVFGQFVEGTTAAAKVGQEQMMSDGVAYNVNKYLPTIAYNPDDDNFLVAFFHNEPYQVYASGSARTRIARMTTDGSGNPMSEVVGSVQVIDDLKGHGGAHQLDLAYRPANAAGDGRFLVTYPWYDTTNIRGTLLDRNGASMLSGGNPIRIDLGATSSSYQFNPAAVYNPTDDEFLVSWTDGRQGASNTDIYGLRVSFDGTIVGNEIEIAGQNTGAINNQDASHLAYNPVTQEYYSVWMDFRGMDSEFGANAGIVGMTRGLVYGQRIK